MEKQFKKGNQHLHSGEKDIYKGEGDAIKRMRAYVKDSVMSYVLVIRVGCVRCGVVENDA